MRPMAKLVVAWEAGGYFGHEMLVTAAALALQLAGHDVVIAAPEGVASNTAARAAGLRWRTLPGGAAPAAPGTGFRWKSRATSLWSFGFHSPQWLDERLRIWSSLLAEEVPDALVLQAAPCGQLAARVAGVPTVEFGIGFDVPPRHYPFPAFRNREAFSVEAGARFERRLVDVIQSAVVLPTCDLATLVCGDQRVVVSLPELDHYSDAVDGFGRKDPSRRFAGPLPPVPLNAPPVTWKGDFPRILAYIRASIVDVEAFLQAAAVVGGDWVVVCPGAEASHFDLARRLGVRLHGHALSLVPLLRDAQLVICHGGGLMSESLVQGCPCVAMPIHQEQYLAASALVRHGLGAMVAPDDSGRFTEVWEQALGDRAMQARVRVLASRQAAASGTAAGALLEAVNALLLNASAAS